MRRQVNRGCQGIVTMCSAITAMAVGNFFFGGRERNSNPRQVYTPMGYVERSRLLWRPRAMATRALILSSRLRTIHQGAPARQARRKRGALRQATRGWISDLRRNPFAFSSSGLAFASSSAWRSRSIARRRRSDRECARRRAASPPKLAPSVPPTRHKPIPRRPSRCQLSPLHYPRHGSRPANPPGRNSRSPWCTAASR